MLSFLQIRDFTIIESLDLAFSPGFTVITGETGAGKSIMVDVLALLTGSRADTGAIRSGCEKADLSGMFELEPDSPALAWLREADLDDGPECLLRRLIRSNGRSRAWINGTPVTLSQLAELGSLLVEIHGQNEHLRLTRQAEQIRLLDDSGNYQQQLQDLEQRFQAWKALDAERQALLSESPLAAGEIDLLRFQAEELSSSMLPPNEFLQLESDHRKLARSGEALGALEFAQNLLESGEDNINQQLSRALDSLQGLTGLDPDIHDAANLLNEAAINVQEAVAGVQRAISGFEISPAELEQMEQKLSRQHDLARKHRTGPDQLDTVLGQIQDRLERAGSLEQRLQAIDEEFERALTDYRSADKALSKARSGHARALSRSVTDLLQSLGMEGGKFEIDVTHDAQARPRRRGCVVVQIQVSANPGSAPGPLSKIASGGELSRISLAIKVASKTPDAGLTQVFDEVDAGIGGSTANAVGSLLRRLSLNSQALCVTHLAQVAACADQQFRVLKSTDDETTYVNTHALSDAERVDEIARMLGGKVSDQSRAHASELLTGT